MKVFRSLNTLLLFKLDFFVILFFVFSILATYFINEDVDCHNKNIHRKEKKRHKKSLNTTLKLNCERVAHKFCLYLYF